MFELKIDPEMVNKTISESILKSTLGVQIEKAVKEQLKKFETSWSMQEFVDKAVAQEINSVIRAAVNEPPVRNRIKALVMEKVSDDLVNKLVDLGIDLAIKKDRGY